MDAPELDDDLLDNLSAEERQALRTLLSPEAIAAIPAVVCLIARKEVEKVVGPLDLRLQRLEGARSLTDE